MKNTVHATLLSVLAVTILGICVLTPSAHAVGGAPATPQTVSTSLPGIEKINGHRVAGGRQGGTLSSTHNERRSGQAAATLTRHNLVWNIFSLLCAAAAIFILLGSHPRARRFARSRGMKNAGSAESHG